MSIRSITDLAVERDQALPGEGVDSRSPGRDKERVRDALISAIPAEVLALYTAVTGGALAILIRDEPSSYLPYRWTLLVAMLVLTPASIYSGYRRKFAARKTEDKLGAHLMPQTARVPYLEMTASTLAAAAWFLAAPGSPLLASMSRNAAELTSSTIIVAATAILWAGFGRPLSVGSALEPIRPHTVPAVKGAVDSGDEPTTARGHEAGRSPL